MTLERLGLLLLVVVSAGVFAACDDTSFIDRLLVVNQTEYPTRVEVRGEQSGWLAIATVEAGDTNDVRQVIDQGTTWTFRFSYAGVRIETELTREQLERNGWEVEVPDGLSEALDEEGIQPPP